ncbi:MAG: helix-turn-helix domain-containing protein [Gemmatimonadaceae bacterium]|nr:helix-turn-helix domain-containing protein [Chitinophagaceae bacterium]
MTVTTSCRHVFAHILAIIFLFIYHPASAQKQVYASQQHFTVEDGLPQSFVSGILQDEDGYIWVATLDGICRYDGRGFKTIRYRPADSTSLAATAINNISTLSGNRVTLYYSSTQADDLDMRTMKVKPNKVWKRVAEIQNSYNQTYSITSSDNWLFMVFGYKGVGWLGNKTGKVTYANRANGLLQQDTIISMAQSDDGKIYLLSEDGVQVSDKSGSRFDFLRFPTKVKKLPPGAERKEYFVRCSMVVLGNNRLAVYKDDKITILDLTRKTSRVIDIPAPAPGLKEEASALQVDNAGRPYFTHAGRVFRLMEDGEMRQLWENTANPDLRINSFFIDRSDVLWVSVNAQGLLKVDLQSLPFQSFTYRRNFMVDILVHAGVKESEIPKNWSDNDASYYFRQATDTKGIAYVSYSISAGNLLYKYDGRHFTPLEANWKNRGSLAILSLPGDGLRMFDSKEKTFYDWRPGSDLPQKVSTGAIDLTSVEIADAKFIGGYTWISTYTNGLMRYDEKNNLTTFQGRQVNGVMPAALTEICRDPTDPGKFWVGSRGGGLIRWDVQNGLEHVYTTDDGIPNNTVYCILPDKAGKIWCSTNKGVFRFDYKAKQITAFEKTDGLPGNEFNRAHKFAFEDGRLAFGGIDGYTIFNPADFEIRNQTGEVPIQLTGLQINSQIQAPSNPESTITDPLSALKEIKLPYNKNYLRLEFAALLYNQPQKIRYRYLLTGADETWIDNGTNNIASYAALRPGDYVFRFNATDKNGLWSKTVNEIKIKIRPPFWSTWWAYLIYILAALAIVKWYFVFRDRRLNAEQRLAFEKREALRLKEVDEIKDRFFSNITHEFRTPLTLIITPLEKLVADKTLPTYVTNTLKTAQRNSNQLLRLINEFLDFSKLNNGQLRLRNAAGDPVLFTGSVIASFEDAAREKQITLTFSHKGLEGNYLFDEEKWEKIISNLVGNALKFTPPGGEVGVELLAAGDDSIVLSVKDSGPGIPAGHQEKIFNRFYQVDDSAIRNYGGTGIGLSLVKELTELMKGNIALESKTGGPTRFVVQIPVEKVKLTGLAKTSGPAVKEKADILFSEDIPLLLVVEDNEELRNFLVESLGTNYRVLEAGDGLKGWEVILQELPDIVVSDVMMPGRDGFDLCKLCKTDERTAHIGFVLLSSKAAHDAKLQGLGTGADDYITKPFHLEELVLRTGNLLQIQRKQRAWMKEQFFKGESVEEVRTVTDPFLVKLYEEMDARLDDPELGIELLCRTFSMSRSTLNRKLKSLLDISANELIRQYRLQKAASLITAGSDISSAAYQTGFSSPSYFSQCFKELYGITPSDYISRQN